MGNVNTIERKEPRIDKTTINRVFTYRVKHNKYRETNAKTIKKKKLMPAKRERVSS